jgi:cellulose synthase/poly-beta-1,6-N-acetylglucosamine synthase-like glycosyltransferase
MIPREKPLSHNELKAKERIDHMMIALSGLIVVVTLYLLAKAMTQPSFEKTFFVIILSYSFMTSLRFFFYVFGAIINGLNNQKKSRSNSLQNFQEPKVSILMPAYNESKVIAFVLESFEKMNYTNFEVIVVDDGSSDETYEIAQKTSESLNIDIKVYRKENGGKAMALNYGIEKSSGEFLLCMDSDSVLSPDSIINGIKHFENNRKLASVAGIVMVADEKSLLCQFQQLDYLIGHFQRKALSFFGKVSIVPGPIGLFRKSAVLSVGGYEKDKGTFAEDTELTFRLIAAGWTIECDDGMAAFTEVPDNYNDLLRQRYRWSRGVYQALLKNLDNFIFSQHISNIFFLMFLMWEQVVIPIVDFALLFAFVNYFLMGSGSSSYSSLILYVLFIDIALAVISTLREKASLKWTCVAILSRFTYVNVLLIWKLMAFYEEWKSVRMTWDKLSRNGFVNKKLRGSV